MSQFENANLLAAYMAAAAVLVLGLAPLRPRSFGAATWTLVTAVFAAVFGAAVLATGSRGGLVALSAGLLVTLGLIFMQRSLRTRASVAILVVVLFALLVGATRTSGAFATRNAGPARLQDWTGARPEPQSSTESSNRFRLLTWRGTLDMASARPLLGWGAGSFASAYGPHAHAAYTSHAHSTYLEVAAEQGWLALLTWILALGASLVGFGVALRRGEAGWAPPVCGCLVVLAVHGVFEPLQRVPAISLLLFAAVGMGLSGWASERRRVAKAGSALRRVSASMATAGILGLLTLALGTHNLRQASGLVTRSPSAARGPLALAGVILPFDPDLHQARAVLYQSEGRADAAIASARKMAAIMPYHPSGHTLLGNLLRANGRPEDALAAFRRALASAPREMDYLCLYAAALEEQDRGSEAMALYRRMVELEQSPDARLQPHPNGGEYRYIRAHRALISEALSTGDREQLNRYRERAAALLASRRKVLEGDPKAFRVDRASEARLRQEECSLWKEIIRDSRSGGDPHKAAEAAKEHADALASLTRLKSGRESSHRHAHL